MKFCDFRLKRGGAARPRSTDEEAENTGQEGGGGEREDPSCGEVADLRFARASTMTRIVPATPEPRIDMALKYARRTEEPTQSR